MFVAHRIGVMLGGHVHAVFTLVTIIFVICVSVTLNSFREIPLWKLESQTQNARDISGAENGATENPSTEHDKLQQPNKNGASQNTAVYGTLSSDSKDVSFRTFCLPFPLSLSNFIASWKCYVYLWLILSTSKQQINKIRPKHHSLMVMIQLYRQMWTMQRMLHHSFSI